LEAIHSWGKQAPLVSVVLPSYNHVRYLGQRLHSIVNQSYKQIELIILDDGSTDGSQSILISWPYTCPVRFVISRTNTGLPFRQWARGISIARGEYVWIAESDDDSSPHFLTSMVDLAKRENVALAFSDSIHIDENSVEREVGDLQNSPKVQCLYNSLLSHRVYDGRRFITDYLSKTNSIPNVSAVLFRKDIIGAHVSALTDFRYFGDWYLYIRLCAGEKIARLNQNLNYFRSHQGTTRFASRSFNQSGQMIIEHEFVQRELVRQGFKSLDEAKAASSRFITKVCEVAELESVVDYEKLCKYLGGLNFGRLVFYGYGQVGQLILSRLKPYLRTDNILVIDRRFDVSGVTRSNRFATPHEYSELFRDDDLILIASFSHADNIIAELKARGVSGRLLPVSHLLDVCKQ
jgi:glycosyltransferase involved in cell wall biosynthesis